MARNHTTRESVGVLGAAGQNACPAAGAASQPNTSTPASTLGSAYQLRTTRIHGPTRWTSLSRRRVVLAPHGSAVIHVAIRMPGRVAPGDYLSGISVQELGGTNRAKLRGNVAFIDGHCDYVSRAYAHDARRIAPDLR